MKLNSDTNKVRDVHELERMYRMTAWTPWKPPAPRPGPLRCQDEVTAVTERPRRDLEPFRGQSPDPVHVWIREAHYFRKRAEFAEAQVDRLVKVMRTPWVVFAWWFLMGAFVGGLAVGVMRG